MSQNVRHAAQRVLDGEASVYDAVLVAKGYLANRGGLMRLALQLELNADECITYVEQRARAWRQDSWHQTERDARRGQAIAEALDQVVTELRQLQQARANGN